MPLTVGGGVRTVDDFRQLLANGADKVAVNTVAIEQPDAIDRFARRFGRQAVVVSIDTLQDRVKCRCGRMDADRNAVEWALEIADRGAGEILLQSIDRDGMMNGYDLDLIHEISSAVDIPVIASGGCGSYQHIAEALKAGAHAAAVGAMFQFCDATPKGAARYLAQQGFSVRL
jgi:cyclase